MLRDELNYRLGNFILIERDGITLSWVTHSPFGGQRSGRCYILGSILVLLPCDHVEPDYLKQEFHKHLRKVPQWTKTIYYCHTAVLCESAYSKGSHPKKSSTPQTIKTTMKLKTGPNQVHIS